MAGLKSLKLPACKLNLIHYQRIALLNGPERMKEQKLYSKYRPEYYSRSNDSP